MAATTPSVLPEPVAVTRAEDEPRRRWLHVTIAIVLVGAALRIVQYLWQQSYWNDEASLLLNIFTHTAAQLLGPLKYDQASPPLFLLSMRAMHVMLGRGELAMRLLPLGLGIGALMVFARLAWVTLPPAAGAAAVALFAVSNHLIAHAAEAKQYSGDAFVAALLLLLGTAGAPLVPAHRRLERVSLVAIVAMWFSHPTAFVFGGIALALGAAAWRERRVKLPRILLAMAAPAGSFLILYVVSIRQQQSQMLFEYWDEKFAPLTWMLPVWLVRSLVSLFDYAYDHGGFLLLPLGIVGAVHLWRRGRRELLAMLVLPIVLTLAAATLRRYPFGGTRLTLFLAPACLLLVGAGLAMLRPILRARAAHAWTVLVIVLIAINGSIAAYHLAVPRYRGNMRPVLEYIRTHRNPDEPVFALRHVEFLIYWPNPDESVFIGNWPKRFPAHGRFWVALSVGQGSDKLRKELRYDQRGLGEPTSITQWRGGAALFYDRERK